MSTTSQEALKTRVNAKGFVAALTKSLKEASGQGHFVRRGENAIEVGILTSDAREILQRNLARLNPNANPVFDNIEDDYRRICGTLFTSEIGPIKTEVRRFRRQLRKEISLFHKGSKPIVCKTPVDILGRDVRHLKDAVQKTLNGVYSDAVLKRDAAKSQTKPPEEAVLARIPLVQLSWPLSDLGKDIDLAVENTLKSEAAANIENPVEREWYVNRALNGLKSPRTNLPLLKNTLEENLLGITRRAGEIMVLVQIDPARRKPGGTDKSPLVRFTDALMAISARSHYNRPDADFLFINPEVFGDLQVNTKNGLGQANAFFDWLPISATLKGLLHENRDEPKGSITLSSLVKFKANGKSGGGTGLSSYQYVCWKMIRDWKTIKRLKDSDRENDEKKLRRALPKFLHRLLVTGACHTALTSDTFDIDKYFATMQKIWSGPEMVRLVDKMLDRLDSDESRKVWTDLGTYVKDKCLKSSSSLSLTETNLVLTISKDLIDYENIEDKPIIDPPVRDFAKTYLQFVHVGLHQHDDDPLIRKSITLRITETSAVVSPAVRPRLTIRRDLSIPVLSVRVFTSPQVRGDLPADGNGSNSPIKGNIVFQFDQASPPKITIQPSGGTPPGEPGDPGEVDEADDNPVVGPPPTFSIYLLAQSIFAFFFFEVLARRQDEIAARSGGPAGHKTPILICRYSTTGRMSDMQAGDVVDSDGLDDEIEKESDHDAAVRGIMRAIEFMLSKHRLVLSQGYCVKQTKGFEHRLAISLRAALAELDADITVPNMPSFTKAVFCVMTSGKADGIFGVDNPTDVYVQMMEFITLDYTPSDKGDGAYRVRVYKKVTELTSGDMRFNAMGDGYGTLKELLQNGYDHCLFLSRSPFSHRFGITRDRDYYYCNPTFLNNLSNDPEMAGLHLYPLLSDAGHGIRKMPRQTAETIASLFRISYDNAAALLRNFSPAEYQDTTSPTARRIMPVCTVGTYFLRQGLDLSSLHCGLMNYTTPVDPQANLTLQNDIKEMVSDGPVHRTILDIISAVHLFRSQKGGTKDAASFTLQPFRSLLSDEGQSVRRLSQLDVSYLKQTCRLQFLALLHALGDIFERVDAEDCHQEALRRQRGEDGDPEIDDIPEGADQDEPHAA